MVIQSILTAIFNLTLRTLIVSCIVFLTGSFLNPSATFLRPFLFQTSLPELCQTTKALLHKAFAIYSY